MLTYNEAHNLPDIAKMLDGVIDDVVLLDDTKSSDGTESIAHGLWFGRVKVHKSTLTSFAEERNKLLEYARDGLSDTDYIMIMDPDDRPDGMIPKSDLFATLYFCTYHTGNLEWMMPLLLRADYPFYYVGAAHELLKTGEENAVLLPDFHVYRLGSGASEERKEWSINALASEPDNPRSVFYLARTYQNVGRRPEALYQFLRRVNMPSEDAPETYYALFCAAYEFLDVDPASAELMARRAILFSPNHKEPYYILAHLYNMTGQHDLALEACDTAIAMPPCTDITFVDRWVEAIGLHVERHAARERLGLPEEQDIYNG